MRTRDAFNVDPGILITARWESILIHFDGISQAYTVIRSGPEHCNWGREADPDILYDNSMRTRALYLNSQNGPEYSNLIPILYLQWLYPLFASSAPWSSPKRCCFPRCKVRVGFMGRLRQVECVEEHERKNAFQSQQQLAQQALNALLRPFKPEVVDALRGWATQYDSQKMRYKFLVLRGGSQTGKSTLAKALGQVFNWPRPFVQTVQSAEAPDLKQYNREEHGYIVFDNVNHMDFVLNERALFQANNDLHTLAGSRTGMYAYSVWLFAVPLVVTVDLTAEWDSTEIWLADNMFELALEGPCFLWGKERLGGHVLCVVFQEAFIQIQITFWAVDTCNLHAPTFPVTCACWRYHCILNRSPRCAEMEAGLMFLPVRDISYMTNCLQFTGTNGTCLLCFWTDCWVSALERIFFMFGGVAALPLPLYVSGSLDLTLWTP